MRPEIAGSHGSGAQPPLAAVLAGGQGSRLGGSKESQLLAGRPLISYPLAALASAGLARFVVAKPGFSVADGCEVVHEPANPVHPLLGIVTALERAYPRPVLVVACDMPFLTPELLAWIASRPAPLAVPRVDGRLEPLVARYEPSLLPSLRAGLEAELSLQAAVGSLEREELEERRLARFGDPVQLMLSINTEADLARAETLLARRA